MQVLIDQLIQTGYLKTPRIIEAFQKIKREDFLPVEIKYQASLNIPLPINWGQTISQPLTVAFMLELLEPEEGDKILDVGSGSGWQTALLAYLVSDRISEILSNDKKVGKVYAIERIPELKEFGENNVRKYNFVTRGIVKFFLGDGSKGLPKYAPFDKIIVAAAAPQIPEPLYEQLKVGGRLVIPVGRAGLQDMVVVSKKGEEDFKERRYPGFTFVPLVTE